MPPEFWILPSFLPVHPGWLILFSGFSMQHCDLPRILTLQLKCSKNVVLLSNGLHADVLPLWEEIRWSNHTSHFATKGRVI